MLTYNTFDRNKIGLLTQNNYEEEIIDYGESITDKSHYNPNISTFIANQGYINNNPLYHFPDGVDNELNMSLLTNKNLDITEKEALSKKISKQTKEKIDELLNTIDDLEDTDKEEIVENNSDSTSE